MKNMKRLPHLLTGLLLLTFLTAQAGEKSIHPYALYPSKIPGRPGLDSPEIWPHYQEWRKANEAGDDKRALEIVKPFMSDHFLFGYPEFEPYPGSVEHVRCRMQRYVPPYPLFNQNTLVKNVLLRDHKETAASCVPFSEPVYWTSQWNVRFPTSQKKDVGKVYPWKPGESVELTVGPLPPKSMYAVRIIGAIKPEDVVLQPTVLSKTKGQGLEKQFVFQFEINDKPDGSTSTYILRGRPWDQFYEVCSALWHGLDDRIYKIKITLLPESEAVLFAHNIDVHNVFGESPFRAGKTKATTYSPEARRMLRENSRSGVAEGKNKKLIDMASGYQSRIRGKNSRSYRAHADELLADVDGPLLTGEARKERDDILWHSLPPLNHQTARVKVYTRPELIGGWETAKRHAADWDERWKLIREKDGKTEVYTWEDMAAYKTLPGTKDRGYGVVLPVGKDGADKLASIIASAHWSRWRTTGSKLREAVSLYDQLGDRNAARDAAFLLARMAYHYPALRGVNTIDWAAEKDPTFRGNDNRGGRYFPDGWQGIELEDFAGHYDKLFDFIKGNEELAQAVGRYIPWVKKADDLRFLFDVYLVQNYVRDVTHYRRVTSGMTAGHIIRASVIQNNNEISRPWMEFIFTKNYEYPNALAGMDDFMVTSVTRDGSDGIGSYFYCAPKGLEAVNATRAYIKNGGDPEFDLGNMKRYPKNATAPYFGFESRVGGGFYPGIGDVGGPARPVNYHVQKVTDYARSGWGLTKDPQFAWWMVHKIGRKGQTDEQWDEIEKAAATVKVSPLLNQHSRVLGEWFSALESGVGNPDFRFHRAAVVNVGNGKGHAHNDTMDLRIWALGANMSGDFGQRQAYGRPRHGATFSHNLVEVDGDGGHWLSTPGRWDGYAWARTLFDAPGAPYTMAESTPPKHQKNVKVFRRQVALIDVDEGKSSNATDHPEKDENVTLPASYVFDVFRVSGGKRHTYCFHGSVDDNHVAPGGFEVNIKNRQLMTEEPESWTEVLESNRQYLRNFRWGRDCKEYTGKDPSDLDKEWAADPASDTLRATWRMGIQDYRNSLDWKAADVGGRKYIRMHLFNVGDCRVLHGINTDVNGNNKLNREVPHYAGRCLYVQKDTKRDSMDSAFVALLEPYAGEPVITESKALDIPANEDDALRAVAVSVKTRYNTEDLLFADGRPEKERALPGNVTVAGEYAAISRDAKGLRRATLTGGTRLTTPDLDIRMDKPAYTGKVVAVDLLAGRAEVEGVPALPQLAGSFFEIGNKLHRSSYEIKKVSAAQKKDCAVLQCRKGLEIMLGSVTEVDYEKNQVRTNVAMFNYEGRNSGLVATNGRDRSKRWRVKFEGGDRFDGFLFTLTGSKITKEDFKAGDKLSIWEFGVGDTATLKTGVSMSRETDREWQVYANASVKISMANKKLEWSADGKKWQVVSGPIGPGCAAAPDMPCTFYIRITE